MNDIRCTHQKHVLGTEQTESSRPGNKQSQQHQQQLQPERLQSSPADVDGGVGKLGRGTTSESPLVKVDL